MLPPWETEHKWSFLIIGLPIMELKAVRDGITIVAEGLCAYHTVLIAT